MTKRLPPDGRFWIPLVFLWAASLVTSLHGVGAFAVLLFVTGIGYVIYYHY